MVDQTLLDQAADLVRDVRAIGANTRGCADRRRFDVTTTGFSETWLNHAIGVVSEVIVLHGPQYAPLLDRLERELAAIKSRTDDPVSRARRHLERARAEASP